MRKDDSDRIEKWAATSLRTALVLLLTLTLCGPAAVAQFASHGNFQFADAEGCSESQTSIECISVDVFAQSNGQTFLFYDDFIFDLSTGASLQDTSGNGQIPNSAFQVHGQTDSLNVDTSKISPDVFTNLFCTFDPNTGETCNPIPGGLVTATWTVITNLLTSQSTGTFSETLPNIKFIQSGTTKSQRALASVNVLGAALANATGQVGTAINTFISVQVGH